MDESKVILLPGLDGTGRLFEPLLQVLPKTINAQAISYPVDRLVPSDQLVQLAIQQVPGHAPLVLIGESFSGAIALRWAVAEPHRVRAVLLCASFVRTPAPQWTRWGPSPWLFRLPMPGLMVKLLLLGWHPPECLVKQVTTAVRLVSPQVLADRVRQIGALDCVEALVRCPGPILYLQATNDALVREGSLRTILAARPDVVVRRVSGPHLLLQASPREAWHEIEQFVGTCP